MGELRNQQNLQHVPKLFYILIESPSEMNQSVPKSGTAVITFMTNEEDISAHEAQKLWHDQQLRTNSSI